MLSTIRAMNLGSHAGAACGLHSTHLTGQRCKHLQDRGPTRAPSGVPLMSHINAQWHDTHLLPAHCLHGALHRVTHSQLQPVG